MTILDGTYSLKRVTLKNTQAGVYLLNVPAVLLKELLTKYFSTRAAVSAGCTAAMTVSGLNVGCRPARDARSMHFDLWTRRD